MILPYGDKHGGNKQMSSNRIQFLFSFIFSIRFSIIKKYYIYKLKTIKILFRELEYEKKIQRIFQSGTSPSTLKTENLSVLF